MHQQLLNKFSTEIRELNSAINCKWLHLHAMEHVMEYAGELHPFDICALNNSILELQMLRGYKLGLERAVITTVRTVREEHSLRQLPQ